MRLCNRSCRDVLRVLFLCLKVATLQLDPCRRPHRRKIHTGPQRERSDTRNPRRAENSQQKTQVFAPRTRRGSRERRRHLKKNPLAHRTRRSPQRAARARREPEKTFSFCASTTHASSPLKVARASCKSKKTCFCTPIG